MKPEETIELLKGIQNEKVDYAELVCAPAFAYGYQYVYPEPEDYAIEEAIEALKEVQRYREIGTVEECREARANQKPKIVKDRKWAEKFQGIPYCVQGDCRKCGCKVIKSTNTNYCYVCGPLLNWNDEWTDDDLREFFI